MKYSYLLLLSLFSPLFAFAALDVSFSSDEVRFVSGEQMLKVGTGGTVDSFTVDTSTIDITLSAGASISLTSTSSKEVSIPVPISVSKTSACSDGTYVATVTQSTAVSGAQTLTATPRSTACSVATATSNTGSNDGGGTISGGGGGGSTAQSTAPTVSVKATQSSAVSQSVFFIRDLNQGIRGDDVRQLQTFLAQDKGLYPEGTISGFYGPLTVKAVRAFQKKYGIDQVGRVGPQTRAKLNEVFGGKKTASPTPLPASSQPSGSEISNQEKVKALLQQLQILQEQLRALQVKSK